MLPPDATRLLAVTSILLAAGRYLMAWWFFRSHATTLRGLVSVPWPLRAKLKRPSYRHALVGLTISTKLIGLMIVAPATVAIALWLQPEWVTGADLAIAGTSLCGILAFAIGDPSAMRAMRARYGVPDDWKALLR